MRALITGAGGFLGQRLATILLSDPSVAALTLVDRDAPAGWSDPRVATLAADIARSGALPPDLVGAHDVIYHLAAVVSGEAEADFDLGMRVNVDGSRHVLEACRAAGHVPRVVFTSSVAVFGPQPDGVLIDDRTAVAPRSSYGMEKAVAELLLGDYHRRGFVDGVVLRVPTVSVRPGCPNAAASSFASGIIREPLGGMEAICPVPAETRLWLLSPAAAINNLRHAATLPRQPSPIINLPGLSVTVAEMVDALRDVAGPDAVARIAWRRDAAVEAIVASWPDRWDDARARDLGFAGDRSMTDIIRIYLGQC